MSVRKSRLSEGLVPSLLTIVHNVLNPIRAAKNRCERPTSGHRLSRNSDARAIAVPLPRHRFTGWLTSIGIVERGMPIAPLFDVTDKSLQHHDIERICRDVISTTAVAVSLLRVSRIETGWRIIAKDRGDRLISVEVPSGPATVVRAVLRRWTADQEEDVDAVVL